MASLRMTTKLSRKYIAPERDATLHLLIDLEAVLKENPNDRLPLNLGFVIDRSGSMAGEKLDYTKQAVQYAASHFTPQDYASLTVYDDEVQVLFPAKPIKFKDEFKGIVNRIFPGGMTNLSGGLIQGYQEVARHVRPDQVNRVLLLTDGLANRGITEPARLFAKVAGMKKAGVTVTTFGVGDDFNEDLLTKMAEQSGGNYYFIDSIDHIPRIFAQELESLLSVVAQNVKLGFRCADAVEVTKVWNYRPSGDRQVEIGLPDLFSADRKLVVLELRVKAGGTGPVSLGTVSVSYDDAGGGLEHTTFGIDLSAEATPDPELLQLPEEPEVMVQVELNRTAEAREEAIRLADGGDLVTASAVMKTRFERLNAMQDLSPEMSAAVEEEKGYLCEAVEKMESCCYDANTRKQMSYQNYKRRNTKKS